MPTTKKPKKKSKISISNLLRITTYGSMPYGVGPRGDGIPIKPGERVILSNRSECGGADLHHLVDLFISDLNPAKTGTIVKVTIEEV